MAVTIAGNVSTPLVRLTGTTGTDQDIFDSDVGPVLVQGIKTFGYLTDSEITELKDGADNIVYRYESRIKDDSNYTEINKWITGLKVSDQDGGETHIYLATK